MGGRGWGGEVRSGTDVVYWWVSNCFSQSSRADKIHNSFNLQCYPKVYSHFLSVNFALFAQSDFCTWVRGKKVPVTLSNTWTPPRCCRILRQRAEQFSHLATRELILMSSQQQMSKLTGWQPTGTEGMVTKCGPKTRLQMSATYARKKSRDLGYLE